MELRTIFLATGLFCLASVCAGAEDKVTYTDHVLPIFRNQCLTCHDAGKAKGGLDLSSFVTVMEGGSSGDIVVPGDPDASRLYLVLAHLATPFMPEDGDKRPDEELDTVREWILGGLLDNKDSAPLKPKRPKVDLAVVASDAGRPEGPPPMPEAGRLEPVYHGPRPNAVIALGASPWAPLAAVGGHRQVALFNTDSLELVDIRPFEEGLPYQVGFSRNASLVFAAGGVGAHRGHVVLWDVETGDRITRLADEEDAVLAADLSPDHSRVVIGGTDKRFKVFDTAAGTVLHNVKKHTDWVTAVAFSPDNVLFATGDRAGNLYVWEAGTGQEFHALRGHTDRITALAWRHDGNLLASASEDGSIRLWDMHKGRQVKNWTGHKDGTLDLAYAGDARLVSVGRDRKVRVWNPEGGEIKAFGELPDLPTRCDFTHDGKRVLAGAWDGSVTAWDIESGTRIGVVDANPPTLSERVETATAERADALARIEELDGKTAAADERARALGEEITGLSNRRNSAEKQKADAERQRDETRTRMEQATARRTEQAKKRGSLEQQIAALQADLVKVQAAEREQAEQEKQANVELKGHEELFAQVAAELESLAGSLPARHEARNQAQAEAKAAHDAWVQARQGAKAAEDALARWTEALATHQALASVPAASPVEEQSVDLEGVFALQVRPVFETHCVECHGPDKQKGKLVLHTPNGILSVVTPSDPDDSELYYRISRPHDDVDIMPPEEQPLTTNQVESIRTWIADGAVF